MWVWTHRKCPPAPAGIFLVAATTSPWSCPRRHAQNTRRWGANRSAGDRADVVVELLGGVALDEEVAVVQGVEVNLDDISVGVVDPHGFERKRVD